LRLHLADSCTGCPQAPAVWITFKDAPIATNQHHDASLSTQDFSKVCYLMSCLIVVPTNPAFLGTVYAMTTFIPSPQCMQNRLIVAPPGVEPMHYCSQRWQPSHPSTVASLGGEANKSGSLFVTCSPTFSSGWDPLLANLPLHAQVGMFSTAAVQDLVWLGCSWPPLRH
jgi:hypothetical protein